MTESAVLNYLHISSPGENSRPALIFVHGLFGSGDNWMTLGRKLADKRQVFLIDLPNHGDSPWTNSADYHRAAQLLDATLAQIASAHPEIPAFSLLGHSMGGKLVMTTALISGSLPECASGTYRIDRIVVADIAPREYSPAHHEIFAAMAALPLGEIASRSDADRHLAQRLPDAYLRAFLLKNLRRDEAGDFRWKLNLDVLISDYSHILGWDADGQWTNPVLFLKGEKSDYIDSERDGDAINTLFPESRIETISGAGHWLHAEKPAEVLSALRSFID